MNKDIKTAETQFTTSNSINIHDAFAINAINQSELRLFS